jgi:lipopolysaccharide biosynthesis glycosyltransferase
MLLKQNRNFINAIDSNPSVLLEREVKLESYLDSNAVVVVCAADNKYAMQVAITIRSIVENLSSDRKLIQYIIDGGIKERNKRKILESVDSQRCEIRWLPKPDALLGKLEVEKEFCISDDVGAPGYISLATYYRLVIPTLLPNEYKKAIYLDCDLVVNCDLGKLWDIDLKENAILAAQDQGALYISSPAGLLNYQELGISPDAKYFNAGVLVMNLEKWRTDNIVAQAIECARNKQEFIRWHDQDVLNMILAGKWGELDPRWNQMPQAFTYSSWSNSPFSENVYNNLVSAPYIVHFSSASKPWNSRKPHPFHHLFIKYVDLTVWSGWRLTIFKYLWQRLIEEIQELQKRLSKQKLRRS